MRGPQAALALALVAGCVSTGVRTARAIPPPDAPRSAPSIAPTSAPPASAILPFGSTLLFVLDDRVNSGSTKPGTVVHMHLKNPIVVNGVTVAPAGAPATLAIVTTQRAHSGDVDGAVQIHLDPLALADKKLLPIRAYHEYLNVHLTGGELATRSTTDTIADIFIPGHALYHAFRRGRQLVLPVGSILRAETAATITVPDAADVVLSTPPPFVSTYDPPHADLTAPPFYTPQPARPKPLPKGKPTLPPTPAATSSPSAR